MITNSIKYKYFKEILDYSLPLIPHNISQWGYQILIDI